jgi:RNA polymerase sigma-70 factor, ECF subfamily
MGEVTGLLRRWSRGDQQAAEELIPLVYGELKRLAGYYLRMESGDATLSSTALVHEAYLRLAGGAEIDWQDRGHFFAVASRQIRNILVDHARRRNAAKRDVRHRAPIEDAVSVPVESNLDIEELDEALHELERFDPQKSQIVELRFFGGLSIEETASALRISPATVKREWTLAKLWLFQRMNHGPPPPTETRP